MTELRRREIFYFLHVIKETINNHPVQQTNPNFALYTVQWKN